MNVDNQKTILLVEDELLVALNQKQTLEKYGFKVITAKNGEKALELVEESPSIDLVLMDICLGDGIDGAEAADYIIKKYELPLLFLSSHVEPEIVGRTDGIRSCGYVVKNSGETVLIASVRMALDHINLLMEERDRCRILSENESKYRMIFEHSPQAIIFSAPDGRIFEANPAACRLLGRPMDEICRIGRDGIMDNSDPDVARAIEERGRKGRYAGELRCLNPDGSSFPVGIVSAIFRDINGDLRSSLFFCDISEQREAEEKIRSLLREKEILLKETHHRIKNNMHTIYSLLVLQANSQKDPHTGDVLKNAASRVQSMVILYDKLYSSNLHHMLNIKDYLVPLVNEMMGVFFKLPPVQVAMDIEDFILSARILSPIGIIINELITNSMKYAFRDSRMGCIAISVKKNENLVTLTYSDNGPGLPDAMLPASSSTFGFTVINLLVEQINGSIVYEKSDGLKFVITFNV